MAKLVQVKVDRLKDFHRQIRELTLDRVLVGIPDIAAEREPDPDEPLEINNATIGYLNEFGAPDMNIPERPHLVPGVRNALPEIERRYVSAAKALLTKDFDPQVAHHAVGLIASSSVKRKIKDGPFTPLSEFTLAKRRAKGRMGIKPLQDTGQYRNAVTYVVRRET